MPLRWLLGSCGGPCVKPGAVARPPCLATVCSLVIHGSTVSHSRYERVTLNSLEVGSMRRGSESRVCVLYAGLAGGRGCGRAGHVHTSSERE